jgi:hypothetical protein
MVNALSTLRDKQHSSLAVQGAGGISDRADNICTARRVFVIARNHDEYQKKGALFGKCVRAKIP